MKIRHGVLILASLFLFELPVYAGDFQVAIWDQFMVSGSSAMAEPTPATLDAYVVPLFLKHDGQWGTLDTPLERQTWTAGFDGRDIGRVRSAPAKKQVFDEIKNLQIAENEVKHLDKPRMDPDVRGLRYHPLVLVKGGEVKDPDKWQPAPLPPDLLKKLRHAVHQKYSAIHNGCSGGTGYPDASIVVVKSYRSRSGSFIASIDFMCEAGTSSEELGSLFLRDIYFALPINKDVVFMGPTLTLIDAGDYDANGKSELLFSDGVAGLTGYSAQTNDDHAIGARPGAMYGYSIWSADFTLLARRSWNSLY